MVAENFLWAMINVIFLLVGLKVEVSANCPKKVKSDKLSVIFLTLQQQALKCLRSQWKKLLSILREPE